MASTSLSKSIIPVKVLAGNRVTIPYELIKEWALKKGDTVWVTFGRSEIDLKTVEVHAK